MRESVGGTLHQARSITGGDVVWMLRPTVLLLVFLSLSLWANGRIRGARGRW